MRADLLLCIVVITDRTYEPRERRGEPNTQPARHCCRRETVFTHYYSYSSFEVTPTLLFENLTNLAQAGVLQIVDLGNFR